MPQVSYMHLCDYAFPGEGGKPCIIGIFEVIHAPQFPVAHPLMFIAVQIQGTPHEHVRFNVELGRPNGDVLVAIEAEATVNEAGMAFIPFRLTNVVFPEAARYTVRVLHGGQTLSSQSIRLVRMPAQNAPAPPEGRTH